MWCPCRWSPVVSGDRFSRPQARERSCPDLKAELVWKETRTCGVCRCVHIGSMKRVMVFSATKSLVDLFCSLRSPVVWMPTEWPSWRISGWRVPCVWRTFRASEFLRFQINDRQESSTPQNFNSIFDGSGFPTPDAGETAKSFDLGTWVPMVCSMASNRFQSSWLCRHTRLYGCRGFPALCHTCGPFWHGGAWILRFEDLEIPDHKSVKRFCTMFDGDAHSFVFKSLVLQSFAWFRFDAFCLKQNSFEMRTFEMLRISFLMKARSARAKRMAARDWFALGCCTSQSNTVLLFVSHEQYIL